jgi:hypothetical protein
MLKGNAERLINLALSQGHLNSAYKAGITKEEIGWDTFKTTVEKELGSDLATWHFSYYLRYPNDNIFIEVYYD